ncbi:MAG: Gldg family protein [Proteobacteria bacterium]|nr:Gldg family protein [Pseudomonadota bacterium]
MKRRTTLGGGLLLAYGLLFIGLTMLFNQTLRGWRLDLTQGHLYTTSPGTNRIIAGIREPITLYYFFSASTAAQLPQIQTYGVRVREFLEELAARSNGKIHLRVIDPQPFSEEEDRASELGVRSTPVGASGNHLYFGLAGTNSTDGHGAIEFFDPAKEQFLEYDVVKLIHQLANPKRPVVAWYSSLAVSGGFDPQTGQQSDPWTVYADAQQLFDVRPLAATATHIDRDVNVVVLVHPKNLPAPFRYALDQYALRGGHLLVFVDPLAESDPAGGGGNPMAAMTADKSSSLPQLFAAWGIAYNPAQVVVDRGSAMSVTMREGEEPVQHLGVLGLDHGDLSAADVVTAGLGRINVAMAGDLEPVHGATTRFEPLLQSSSDAALLPVERFRMLTDPSTLREGFKPTGKRYTLGARVSGKVHSAFASGPPPGVTPDPATPALKESAQPLALLVFADTDMLSDFLWVRQQNFFGQRVAEAWASNGALVQNALDNLAGSSDLISLRSRATYSRPFERVEALRRTADDRFRSKEQELERQLQDTEQRLSTLQTKGDNKGELIVTPEQQREIDHFQTEKLRIRKELRAVRAGLDADIHGMGNRLKLLNIVIVPALFALLAVLLALWRRNRSRAQTRGAP